MKKEFTKYDAIAFAEEPSFIRWVRHKEPEARQFWEKWLQDHPEKKPVIQEAKVLVQAIQIKEIEPTQNRMDALWSKINEEIDQTANTPTVTSVPKTATVRSLRPLRWLGYAAAAAVAALLFFQIYNPTTSVVNGKGNHLAYTLPDQSTIELNADSKIAYKAKDWSKERIVELEGEAFFDVEKGVTFKVITPQGQVEVLGTSFNVNTRNGNLVVDCKTGKVKVTAKGDTEILPPGKGTRLNANKTELIDTYASNVEQQTSWRKGAFYFENTQLATVIAELERQYDIKIEADASLKQQVGNYNFQGNLKTALNDVCYQLNAEPIINGKEVKIIKK